jgi:hypothetical protein
MQTRLSALTFIALLLPGALRAADKADPPPVKVRGIITLDGKPLAGATVTFQPVDKKGNMATGKTDEAGNYVLRTADADGALPGKYKVTVSVTRGTRELIPAQYSDKEKTSLEVAVVAGNANEINLELKSK